MRVFVEAVGVLAPGLNGWTEARPVVAGERSLVPAPFTPGAPNCLPAAERRRCGATARLALAVAEQAIERSSISACDMEMVFASYEAAGEVTHQLCEILAGSREVSPTLFHNSVHNAPLGYLSIAVGAKRSGTSVCHGEWSFSTGLQYAALQAACDMRPVLFACYDGPLPPPLCESMPMLEPTAIALVLSPEATGRSLASWELARVDGSGRIEWPDWVPAAWHANASARGFAALAALIPSAARSARLALSPEIDLEIRCL